MKSAFEAAEQYFEEAAAVMNLTSSMRDLLLIPEREVKVQVPIKRDNGEIATVSVNGRPATITTQHAGVADWIITLAAPADGRYLAQATDRAGNAERMPHKATQVP